MAPKAGQQGCTDVGGAPAGVAGGPGRHLDKSFGGDEGCIGFRGLGFRACRQPLNPDVLHLNSVTCRQPPQTPRNSEIPNPTELHKFVKALEEVVALHLQHLASVQNPVPEVNESEVDHGNCSADELPCKYSWEGPCCSLSACLKPEDPEYDYPGYADGQCSFNTTKCWYYCKERNEKNQEMVNGFVEKLVEMFKGASADLRLSYNDTKRRELIGLVPMLNMSYNDLLAQIKSLAAGHPLLYNMSGKPWSEPLADALEAAAYDLDKLESVAVKNLPGMKVTWTFTNVRPFKVLGSLVQDLGLLELLRPTPTTPGMIEAGTTTGILATTANTAVTTASPAESFKNWEDFVEFMPPGTASTPRAKAAAVPEEEEVPLVPELDLEREVQKGESLFLDAEEKAEAWTGRDGEFIFVSIDLHTRRKIY